MNKLIRTTDRVYYYPFDDTKDRPILGYIRGDEFSVAVDAGHSAEHVADFYAAIEEEGLPLPEVTVITHWHWDHTFGMHAVAGKTVASRRTQAHLLEVIEEYAGAVSAASQDAHANADSSHPVKYTDQDSRLLKHIVSLDPHVAAEYASGQPMIVVPADSVFGQAPEEVAADAAFGQDPEEVAADGAFGDEPADLKADKILGVDGAELSADIPAGSRREDDIYRLNAGGVTVELIEAVSAHTDDTTLVYIPEEGCLFMGDSVMGDFQTGEVDTGKMNQLIITIEAMDFTWALTGHWPLRTKTEVLADMRAQVFD